MNTSTKIAVTAAFFGALGLSGLGRVVATQTPIAITQHSGTHAVQASDGDGETNDDVKEKQETVKLHSLAKITPQQAQQAAEAAQGTKASTVKLENENGNLVYTTVVGQKEVQVDAGNGRILATESSTYENEKTEGFHPRTSIQVKESNGDDGDGETNDDG